MMGKAPRNGACPTGLTGYISCSDKRNSIFDPMA